MEQDGNMIIPIFGYVIGFVIPIVGLLYGAALVFLKKDVALYQKHGRFIIYFSIAVFTISLILRFTLG